VHSGVESPYWPGYDGLALALIDAIWSMGVYYGSVDHVVDNYRAWVAATYDTSAHERTGAELMVDIAAVGGPDRFAESVVRNRQRTSSSGGILKAVAVERAARALADEGITTTADLRDRADSQSAMAAWLGVHGQSSGISWHYVLMNARVDDVKADRMIQRFVARSLGLRTVPSTVAYAEAVAAYNLLKSEAADLTRRALDHAIWRHESGRTRDVGSIS